MAGMAAIRVKICGTTTLHDASKAAAFGADALGLNFHPASPRFVANAVAYEIARDLPPFVEPVGVFVEQPLRQVFQALNELGGVRSFQWHGTQPEVCDAFPFRMVVAFPVRDRADLTRMTHYLDACRALGRLPAGVLVDAHVPGHYGGTGQTATWHILADFDPGVPLILAGGLTPENVAKAINAVRPYAVDVASGVESAPGQKEPNKMYRFIQA